LARSRNLLRLERSFSKNAIPSRWFSRVRDGYGAFRIPQGLEAAYKLKGRVSDALAGRHPQTRYRSERIGLAPSRDLKAVQDSLEDGGVLLKKSDKFRTRRVGDWVVKETTARGLIPTLKLTLLRKRYRRAWEAARFLQSQGIHVPAPIAYAEGGAFGIVTGNAVISEFLDGHRNVEDHARALEAESPHDRAQAESFLSAVADAVNALTAAGAYHSDLSGKNIFTADGQTCRFIDLEAVRLNRRYTRVERLTNHVQLCDSFCDLWDDELLGPFIEKMTPRDWDGKAWFAKVRQVQRRRRTHHLDETSGLGPVGRIRRHVGGWLSRRTR
jgi:tRNA A-37 threonylcarbamoyl transferase component Bud32